MTTHVATDLATEVIDLSSIPLYQIRTMHGSLIDDAVRELSARVRNGECVESVQGQRDGG
jgi:hypothetical protein